MDKKSINIEKLSHEISNILKEYSQDTTKDMKNIISDVKNKLVKNTKNDSPKRSGEYKKNITAVKISEKERYVTWAWHVKGTKYRLSHLIANGHAKPDGGRTTGNDYISKNYKKSTQELKNRLGG